MGMRSAAALLLVTLIGPAIISALCDFTCVRHEHHSAQAASDQTCHEQQATTDGPAVAGGAEGFCHDQVETVATTVVEARPLKAAPVAVALPAPLAGYHRHLPVLARNRSSGPPGFIRQTTPLRI
jgi:hypothetical protein